MMPQSSIANTEYANARVRAHRARLFATADYEAMLSAETLQDVMNYLDQSKYREMLSIFSLQYKGARAVGYAASEYLVREYLFCYKYYPPKKAVSIEVLAGLLDIRDFMTVLRGKHAGVSEGEILENFRGPGLCIPRASLRNLAQQETLEDVVATALALRVPFADALKEKTKSAAFVRTLSEVEINLDKAFYAWALKKLGSTRDVQASAKEYVLGRLDAQNVMTLVRFIVARREMGDDFEIAEYYVPGGAAFPTLKAFIKAAQSQSIDELAGHIRVARYARIVRNETVEIALSHSLSSLYKALFGACAERTITQGKRDIGGVGVSIAYLLALGNEAKNVRLIARAKSFGVGDDLLKKELIGV